MVVCENESLDFFSCPHRGELLLEVLHTPRDCQLASSFRVVLRKLVAAFDVFFNVLQSLGRTNNLGWFEKQPEVEYVEVHQGENNDSKINPHSIHQLVVYLEPKELFSLDISGRDH